TAERFLPNPFSSVPGARMYRTGDKVRWLPTGELAFIGRLDFQVKLRGFRIELGEIEATLSGHPDVREALVLLREDVPGDQRLVAYFTSHARSPEPASLRAFLAERLPAYEVPGALVALQTFPLTTNGKVDRKALPSPDATPGADAFVAPLTPTEVRLAALWADILRLPSVGRHDHFFERGGHSLLATQLMARIRSAFSLEIPLRALFEAPTLEQLALRVERATESASLPPLLPAPRDGAPLPLSFAQQRLWFLEQLQPGTPTYNMPAALRLEGPLDVVSLQRAFSELIRRHEALRTSFVEDNGSPFQRISPPSLFTLSLEDLSSVEEREPLARERAHQDAARPFDLSRGPLLRASLLRLAPQQHVLLLNLHHAVSDGWSMGLLVREVTSLYEAYSQGLPSPLPELPLQYADYAVWQRQWLKDEVLARQVTWWKHQLAGAPAVLDLPTDFPRPPLQSFHGRTVDFQLPQALSRAVEAFCKQEGSTLFMGMLTAFQLLLSRYSGQDDISVGSPIAGRRASELEGLIGFFVNTLVLRSRVDPRSSFRELLSQVRSSTLTAYEHQDVPFEKLVEELQPQRSLSHSPLFQVMFTLQNTPTGALEAGQGAEALSVAAVAPDVRSTHFDLTLSLAETPEGFSGAFTYRTDLFEERTITRMAGHFATLLEAAVHAPEKHVGELPLMPVAEREQVLTRWNDTHRELPWDGAIHERLEAQVPRTPDALAILDDSGSLSFDIFNRRVNRLAHWLRSRGVGPEVRVALCMERGADALVALFAILKAGGAYVPTDPTYPRERLTFILQDSGARLVLTQRHLAERLETPGLEVVCLDDPSVAEALSREPESNPTRITTPENLAYVIYTSGSTGRPKGAMIQHASVMNLRVALAERVFSKGEGPLRLAINAPLAFDASVQMLVHLTDGHALGVVPQAGRQDTALLCAWVEKHGIDMMDCSPSHLRLLLDEGLASHRRLRVLVGGEAIEESLWAKLSTHEHLEAFNAYGPTECTVESSCHPIRGTSRPVLGPPLINIQTHVLDARMQPVPLGVPGELFLGGAGVGRGYLDRPDLTAERFLPDPFSSSPGARLYRTGDKVRRLDTGEFEYLGRLDFQVKLRGFRIELGEIEATLEAISGVRRAVVLAREDRPGDKRLVGYLVTDEGRALDLAAVREVLHQSLPEYMVPSAFVFLAALPLNSSDKVDRRALPAPDTSDTSIEYVAPRNPGEETVAALWRELLGVSKVGATDDFFALGGHSLMAVRLMALLRERLGVSLPVSALFQASTVERLARQVEQREQGPRPTPNLVCLDTGTSTERPLFLVHGGGGTVLGYTELVRGLGTQRPIYGLSASGLDGGELPESSVEALARDYLAQLRTVQPRGPYLLGGWSFGGVVAHEMARLLEATGEKVDLLVMFDSHAPTRQPLPEPDTLTLLAGFGQMLGVSWENLSLDVNQLERLGAREVLARALPHLRRSTPALHTLELDTAERLFNVYQRLTQAQLRHVPGGVYTGRTVLFRATRAPGEAPVSEDLGWREWLTGSLTVHDVAGDHFTMLSAPGVSALVEQLARDLEDASS
ncbi:amino acid adenylation domain-containing protein, partial [Myxococcus eversor]|uniref:amino acid adenylation domain-containing protein n=1 Tax=Myxococcus eversor TaxID=2709661 RepID=UPI0013D32CB8